MVRQRKPSTSRRKAIQVGDYKSAGKFDQLLTRMKSLMGGDLNSLNQAAQSASGVPFTYQRGAPMAWLRNTFNAPSLHGISTKDGKRL